MHFAGTLVVLPNLVMWALLRLLPWVKGALVCQAMQMSVSKAALD